MTKLEQLMFEHIIDKINTGVNKDGIYFNDFNITKNVEKALNETGYQSVESMINSSIMIVKMK